MKQHIFQGTVDPTLAPTGVGHHYVNTVTKKQWISVGTSSVADWQSSDDSALVEDVIAAGVTDKAPSQNAVFNALNAMGSSIPLTISADLTVLSGFGMIRPETRIASGITLKIENDALIKII